MKRFFGTVKYDFNTLCERVREVAYLNKGLEISITDVREDKEQTFYFEAAWPFRAPHEP